MFIHCRNDQCMYTLHLISIINTKLHPLKLEAYIPHFEENRMPPHFFTVTLMCHTNYYGAIHVDNDVEFYMTVTMALG